MRDIYRMYKLVRLINEEIKAYNSAHPEITATRTHWHPDIEVIQKKFQAKNKYTMHEILNITAGAIKREYISSHEETRNHDIYHIYCMEPDGHKLLFHIGKYPHGLINEILRDTGPTITLIFGLLGSGIILLLWRLGKFIIEKI